MTRATIPNRNAVQIPEDFPNPHRLGGRDLFIAILGHPAASTFARWLSEGRIPAPRKLGSLNRWLEVEMAAARDALSTR